MRREELIPGVYDALHHQAANLMRQERVDQTLSATALMHEAYLRLGNSFANEAHFCAAAAEAMRRVLVDRARARKRLKRGGAVVRVELTDVSAPMDDDQLLALDEALDRLSQSDPAAARVVELHHFGGASHDAVAAELKISIYEARRLWTYARAWLKDQLSKDFSTTADGKNA